MNIGKIQPVEITAEVQKSYLNYAMSVIVSRALPDVRDGLKPVHRRILFAMHQMGLTPTAGYTKSAKIVGETMGKFHPHGDGPIYDALVRLAQDFSMRYPLVDGQGNFGSVDGDSPAAMRYCVTGNTLVVTDNGLQEIREISQKEDINIKALSLNRNTNRASKWFDSGKHPTIKIKTKHGFKLQGTYNHPILVWTQNELLQKPEYQWKLLEEIKIGDIAIIDRTPNVLWPKKEVTLQNYFPSKLAARVEIKTLPQRLTCDLAFILGSLISEGSVAKNKIEFCNTDLFWISAFEQKWKNTFPDCRLHKFLKSPSSYGKKSYYRLEIHSLHTIEFLRNLGLTPVKAADKAIPSAILKSPKTVVANFLQAYFEGDGSISRSAKMIELSAISTSEKLIEQLKILLLRFGITSTQRRDTYRNTHKLYLRGGKNYKLFQREIGFLSGRKTQKLEKIVSAITKDQSFMDYIPFLKEYLYSNLDGQASYDQRSFLVKHNFDRYTSLLQNQISVVQGFRPTIKEEARLLIRQLLTNNYLFDLIDSIEDGGVQNVYSLKVESKCHSFVANGFVNHNTEARPAKISTELLKDIEKDTVLFSDNFDGTLKEPSFLPAILPNLLLMGSEGIAVGMATKIPPHNLNEVVKAIVATVEKGEAKQLSQTAESKDKKTNGQGDGAADFAIKKIDLAVSEGKQKDIVVEAPVTDFDSEITTEELLKYIKGPDFPTGGLIYGGKHLPEVYGSGRGTIVVRGVAKIEEAERGKSRIVISELPYQVNKAQLVSKIAELARDKKLAGISDLRDESDQKGMSVVIELKKDARPKSVLNNLYKHTSLQTTFPANFVALVDGTPRTLALKQILVEYVKARQRVVTRRSIYDLTEAKKRAHILEGLKIALGHLDAVIATIRKSRDADSAKTNLQEKFGLTEIQAVAILDMQLRRLSALEREKVEEEYQKIQELIANLTDLLTHPEKILGVITSELNALQEKYGDERRTKVYAAPVGEISEEDLVAREEVLVMITKTGYIKRMPRSTYKAQARGGKGVIGMTTKEEDEIAHLAAASTHDQVLFFTDRGRVFATRTWEIAEGSRQARGQAIVNLINIDQGETIQAVVALDSQDLKYLMMATRNGTVKKTALTQFKNLRASGLIAIRLDRGDSLAWVRPTTGEDHVIMATRRGKSIRFKESDVRPMGRDSHGVRGVLLTAGDEVISMEVFPEKENIPTDKRRKFFRDILVVTEKGLGKRTPVNNFPIQKRGGSGVKIAELGDKTGEIATALMVTENIEQIIITSRSGQVIRLPLKNIPRLGRATQGVILMRFGKDKSDRVAAVATLDKEEVESEPAAAQPEN